MAIAELEGLERVSRSAGDPPANARAWVQSVAVVVAPVALAVTGIPWWAHVVRSTTDK